MISHSSAPMAPSRVVVLGAGGFVGSHLVRHLLETGIDVTPVTSRDVDLTTLSAVEALGALWHPVDTVVFVAALTPDKGRDIPTLMKNLQMAQHVCAALVSAPCAHVVYVSSDAVYDDAESLVRETSCTAPGSFHGTMHLVRERMLTETLRDSSPLVIVRPSLLYGPFDTHNGYGPNRFVRTASTDGRIALFGDGEEKRDHVFIGDVGALIELVIRRRSIGTLNIATGEAVSFRAIAELIAELMPAAVRIEPSPRKNPVTHRHFDISTCVAAFPAFRYTTLRAGLADTVRSATFAAKA